MIFNHIELDRMEKFRDKHFKKKCHMKPNKSAASFEIKTVATGIGDAVTIKCLNCDKEEDVTDYKCW